MNVVPQVQRYSEHKQDAPYTQQFLSVVRRLWSQLKRGLRSFSSQLPSEPTHDRETNPASVRCTETIEYNVDVGRRIDYFPKNVVGRIEVRVPYTARHIPWQRDQVLESQTPINVGFLGLSHYVDAGLLLKDSLKGLPHRDLYPDRFLVPLDLPLANLVHHLASGDEAVLEFTYRPQLAEEFPVSIQAELTDIPVLEDDIALYANVPTTFVEDLRLRITILGEMSNLSQEVEQGVTEWVDKEQQRAREEADAWKRIRDALEGEGEQTSGAFQQVAQTIGGKHRIPEDALRKVGRDTVPSLQEARSTLEEVEDLQQCIQVVQNSLKSVEGTLNTEDVADAITKARQAREGVRAQRRNAWLKRLQQQVGSKLEGTHLRYVGVEWPFPEPSLAWPTRSNPLQIVDQGWIYNPEHRSMECYDVPLHWRAKEQRLEAMVELPLSRPPEYQLPGGPLRARGKLVLETKRLLSGLHVIWLDGNKRRTSLSRKIVSLQTEIHVDFEVDLEAAFRHRTVRAHRRLVFEGIVPSEERPREVEHILSDVGLTVLINTRLAGGKTLVQAIWREYGLPTKFSAVLQGRETTDQHTLVFDQERQRVERSVKGGSLRVDLWAEGEREPVQILSKLDDIQTQLQDRWGKGDSSVWQGTCLKEA